jgi:hypothetical protein
MKVLPHLHGPQHRHVVGEVVVEAVQHRLGGTWDVVVEDRHLLASAHPCVGATGTVDAGRGEEHRLHCALELALHRAGVGLQLPAGEAEPVVLEVDSPADHGTVSSRA